MNKKVNTNPSAPSLGIKGFFNNINIIYSTRFVVKPEGGQQCIFDYI